MSRAPRRHFFAPFVLTAAAALPGCHHAKGGTETVIHDNPPASHARTWSVWSGEDGCQAEENSDYECPPDASCNPPPPMMVTCPEGMTGDQVTIVQDQQDGPCAFEDGTAVACPEQLPWEEDEDPEEDLPEDEVLDD